MNKEEYKNYVHIIWSKLIQIYPQATQKVFYRFRVSLVIKNIVVTFFESSRYNTINNDYWLVETIPNSKDFLDFTPTFNIDEDFNKLQEFIKKFYKKY